VINVYEDPVGKLKLEDLLLSYYATEKYDQDLRLILKYLYDNEVVQPPKYYKKANPRLNIHALNFLMDIDKLNIIFSELKKSSFLHPESLKAMQRRFAKNIENLMPILQIKKNDRDEYEEIDSTKNLKSVLNKAQREGTVLILDISRITKSQTYGMFSEIVQRHIQYVREKWFNDEIENSGGNQYEFTKKAPMFLKINEEATYLFANMRDPREVTTHVRDATGARKFNMGTLYVFQTLQGISSNINLILSQLGGFNIVFALTMEPNLKKAVENLSIQGVSHLKQFIKSSKRFKNCLTSCEAYDQRPFFIKFYHAETYYENLFNIKIDDQTKIESDYKKEADKLKDQPKELQPSDEEVKENPFKKKKK
jgi:hypothetical protein